MKIHSHTYLHIYKWSCILILVSYTLFFITGCANIVPPKGGPKDTKPPVVVKFVPPNNSVNFKDKEIRIYFNKFIRLKNVENDAIISPPVDIAPDYSIKGKALLIKIKAHLKDSATYSILLNNCIVDITEGNVNTDLQYVFSTGNLLDSLFIQGNVVDAFTLKPVKDLLVMLYKIKEPYIGMFSHHPSIPYYLLNSPFPIDSLLFFHTHSQHRPVYFYISPPSNPIDSLPYKSKPFYVSRTNADGNFKFRNLSKSAYKIFVLKDMNSDLLYNLPNEQIAYIDSIILPDAKEIIKNDTSKNDTIKNHKSKIINLKSKNDTIKKDTIRNLKSKIVNLKSVIPTQHTIKLYLFQETDSTQKLLKPFAVTKKQFMIPFRYPSKNVQLTFMTSNFAVLPAPYAIFKEFNRNKDTLNVWVLGLDKDSLIFSVKDNNKMIDTVKLNMTLKSRFKKPPKNGEKLYFKMNVNNNTPFDYYKTIILTSNTPLKEYHFDKIFLVEGKDTVKPLISFSDSIKRKLNIKYTFKEAETYKLFIKPEAFEDIYDIPNDTIKVVFKIRAAKTYGSVKLMADFNKSSVTRIMQLLDDKDNIVRQEFIKGKAEINFQNLNPGKYRLKMIYDSNNNGRWDTGNYLKNIQPEKVSFFPKDITCRPNWDFEIDWKE